MPDDDKQPRPTQFCAFCDRRLGHKQGKTPPGYPQQIKLCPGCYKKQVDPTVKMPVNRHGTNWPNNR